MDVLVGFLLREGRLGGNKNLSENGTKLQKKIIEFGIPICHHQKIILFDNYVNIAINLIVVEILFTYAAERRDVLGCISPTTKRFPEA